jgi:protein involved in polysaccharide export with SLBB domain
MNFEGSWTQGGLRGCDCLERCSRRRRCRRTVASSSDRTGAIRARVTAAVTVLIVLALAGSPILAQGTLSAIPGLLQQMVAAQTNVSPQQAQQIQEALKAQKSQKSAQPQQQTFAEPNQPPTEPKPQTPAVETGPSATEQLLSGQLPSDVSTRLRQFGYDVFRKAVSTFAPVMNVPVGPDYVIGPGDAFTLTMWGRADGQFPLQVDRDGQIILPEVGVLKVWGMKFGGLEGYLQHELSRKYTDFKMSVTMNRLRTIQVFVVGEAATPGTYTVSSLSTVINALMAAGGPSKNGSLREIRLTRTGQDLVKLDLYDFLLGGDKSKDVRLQDGDTIFIPLIGPVVGVAGNVKRPAIYEMTGPTTLKGALDLAGGVTVAGWLQRVQVERIESHESRVVVDFDISPAGAPQNPPAAVNTILKDGDVVKVFPVVSQEAKVVFLEGHVLRPGKYEWKPGMRLKDILISYELLQRQPNTEYGEIIRLIPPDLHPTTIPFNLGQLLAGDAAQNIELAQYDTIRTFRWDKRISEKVTISGMVYDPNAYRLVPDMKVRDLIDAAGGLQKNAYLRTAEVTRRHISQDGVATEKIEINLEKAIAGDPENNIVLRDYDYLVIRPIPDLQFSLTAEITGEVRFPGVYPIQKQETLSSLIERAGGYTDQAYLRGSVFTRKSAMEVQRRRLDDMIRQVEESTLSKSQQSISGALDAQTAQSEQASLEAKKELLTKLRSAQITGRVVVKLTSPEEFKGSKYDLELEDGDKLVVPQTPGVVYVVGEVFNPTSLLCERGETVNYYLARVGGMTRDADKKQVSVIMADGSVISIAQGNRGRLVYWDKEYNRWSMGGFMSHRLNPGDTIIVPRKIDKTQWLRNTKDITQIIFQIAVTAGVFLAI